jgi:hypothetical protein
MEMNVVKTKEMRVSMEPTSIRDYDRSDTNGKCGIFQL